ncbi:unnamed protein product [Strongylus vulgaris]|uniref:Uncharacterized protein n=1 Tax=Strongylus vulgaris TaxID=40348 RepID=A0A3P7JTL9_STRVU|nr:unnamed protein product [Strongylus vulgaris]
MVCRVQVDYGVVEWLVRLHCFDITQLYNSISVALSLPTLAVDSSHSIALITLKAEPDVQVFVFQCTTTAEL